MHCVYDNPQTHCREVWTNGRLTSFIIHEDLIHLQTLVQKSTTPWVSGKIHSGDIMAMTEAEIFMCSICERPFKDYHSKDCCPECLKLTNMVEDKLNLVKRIIDRIPEYKDFEVQFDHSTIARCIDTLNMVGVNRENFAISMQKIHIKLKVNLKTGEVCLQSSD